MPYISRASPYLLPEGNVQIAFSGGRTSAYMLRQILDANGPLPERCVVTFQNTGREMPETLDFVQEVGERWAVNVVWLEYRAEKPWFEIVSHNSASREGEPFEALIRKHNNSIPNKQKPFCSTELKTITAKRYLVSIGWKKWTSAVGFRHDEGHRTPFQDNRARIWTPLRAGGVTRHDVIRWWGLQSFDLRLPSFGGKTIGGNCDGCFLKAESSIAGLVRQYPERAAWWERQEAVANFRFSDRYSRAEIRRFVENQGDWLFSTNGALCQKDEGECF